MHHDRRDALAKFGDAATFMERVWIWIHQTFPERQIYIRSDGRVQFFTFGPSLQATLAGLTLIFLGWVAFATVNVIFKDRIIAAKDHRFQEMQSAYENRLADLQISYDELNGALVGAEDKFKATADELQTKQNAIASFLNRKTQVEAALGPAIMTRPPPDRSCRATTVPAGDSIGYRFRGRRGDRFRRRRRYRQHAFGDARPGRAAAAHGQAGSCQPAGSGLHQIAPDGSGAVFAPLRETPDVACRPPMPSIRACAPWPTQTARVAETGQVRNPADDQDAQDALEAMSVALRDVVRRTGINPDQFEHKVAAGEGVGGPEIPLDQVQVNGIHDRGFNASLSAAPAPFWAS